jgi:predicted amidohydrolase YtcJ
MVSKKLSVIMLLSSVLITACQKDSPVTVEKLFTNGVVYTANQTQQVVTSIGITNDRLVYVGNAKDAEALIATETEIIDLNGKMIIPGLHDVHIHLAGIVESDNCDLAGQAFSLTDMVPRLKQCLRRLELPDGEWLTVEQWPYYSGNEPSEIFPTIRSALDSVSNTHPIILLAGDGHHGAVNSVAMSLATDKNGLNIGLSKATLKNEFAHLKALIGIDNSGEPNGVINEDARKIVNLPNLWGYPEIDLNVYTKIAERLAAAGITSTMDAALRINEIASFAKWAAQSPLTYRLTAAFYADFEDYRPAIDQPINIAALMADLTATQQRHEGVLNLKIDTAKIFVDGVIEGDPYSFPPMLPNAASLNNYLQPIFAIDADSEVLKVTGYVDTNSDICVAVREKGAQSVSGTFKQSFLAEHGFLASQCFESNGILEKEYDFIMDYTLALYDAGINIHSHAIGDRAVRVALDTFEAARAASPASVAKFSIAHAQIIHPDDISRIADLDVAIAFTYSWIEPSTEYQMYVTPFIEPTFSEDDLYDPRGYVYKNTYPAASVLTAGGILVAGSDAPVEERDPRPMLNIEKAVSRQNEATGRILNANERVSVRDTLDAYTIKGAQMLGQADITGSLEVGKKADFVILSQDIVALEAQGNTHKISDTKILSTWFDGREIYSIAEDEKKL